MELFKEEIEALTKILKEWLDKNNIKVSKIPFLKPKKEEFGDIATPLPIILSKILKEDPNRIGERILSEIKLPDGFSANVLNGYINFRIDRKKFVEKLFKKIKDDFPEIKIKEKKKVIVEHTSVNPNKAMHVGHIRNSIIGDTLARILRYLGYEVEVQNYIDDTGVQVADSYLALRFFREEYERRKEKEELEDILWDLYPKMYKLYEEKPELLEVRKQVLKAIEEQNNETAKEVRKMAKEIVRSHIKLLNDLGIEFDVLVWESDILREKLWEIAFEELKKSPHFVFEREGEYKGCWVLKLSVLDEFKGLEKPDKVIVRSDGTVTYTGKDIAYAMWKFGIIRVPFKYIKFMVQPSGKILYSTWEIGESMENFGNADIVINVIDVRQSYPQKIVKYALKLLGYEEQSKNYYHLAYEVVALSKETAKELGIEVEEDKKIVHMSGRKGIGIKAKDFFKKAIEKAFEKIKERDIKDKEEVARKVAIAAIRYEMISMDLDKILVFDFNKALNFEGESGPYLQYAYVRAYKILEKAKEKGEEIPEKVEKIEKLGEKFEEWKLILRMAEFPLVLEEIKKDYSNLPEIARYAFKLAEAFNEFYHACPVLQEKDGKLRKERLILVKHFLELFGKVLDLLGIPRLTEM